ncbi:hypothetical protein [Bradyrhizobium sp. G127]|uniref:hypothetical protein n=1 Tax=Bradyrhizobium sp. G127 TaxID=2904800 RepID=UPI001F47652A|nr:hypothetical protein [Bradyrhizobium sp. G127]MCF2522541.1 hypothetical protein [Bradyrhizobium sp. G127]
MEPRVRGAGMDGQKQRNRTRFSRAQPCGKTNGTKRGSLDAARRSIATTRIMASSFSKKISANIVIIHFVNLCLTVWQLSTGLKRRALNVLNKDMRACRLAQ